MSTAIIEASSILFTGFVLRWIDVLLTYHSECHQSGGICSCWLVGDMRWL